MRKIKNNQISILTKKFGEPSNNSKTIKKGGIFFAIKGEREDGANYIKDAIDKGAGAIVAEKDFKKSVMKNDISTYIVSDSKQSYSIACAESFSNPGNSLDLCGITGTNGKTSIAYMLKEIWKDTSGLIGTINTSYGRKKISSALTTPDAYQLNSYLSRMKDDNIKRVFIEVSSHSLALSRIEGINFNSAIFTNISQDHLDFHKTMKRYYESKAKLFSYYLNISNKKNKLAIINIDDKYGAKIANKIKKNINLVTYSIKDNNADFYLEKTNKSNSNTQLLIRNKNKKFTLTTKLFGSYNYQNILAAVAFSRKKGLSIEEIYKAIKGFRGASGRLEKISSRSYAIFLDYAHTPDALKKSIISLKENFSDKNLTVLFGCGGNRDRSKRAKMGKIASSLADNIIVTSDNPRNENPTRIIEDIVSGIDYKEKYKLTVIEDRKKAIQSSINKLKRGDLLLVAGKGHENYQEIQGIKLKFSDKMEIKKCLKK